MYYGKLKKKIIKENNNRRRFPCIQSPFLFVCVCQSIQVTLQRSAQCRLSYSSNHHVTSSAILTVTDPVRSERNRQHEDKSCSGWGQTLTSFTINLKQRGTHVHSHVISQGETDGGNNKYTFKTIIMKKIQSRAFLIETDFCDRNKMQLHIPVRSLDECWMDLRHTKCKAWS